MSARRLVPGTVGALLGTVLVVAAPSPPAAEAAFSGDNGLIALA